ncbi:DUF4232 domain-containing protein [Sphingomonas aerophila]|uniref:DUF4232 domain-containing protein n=1 Tax=Sphingomonas aerophila TaxID=1344948 RepID=A0A7W9BFF5_9SPHN|nr:hypothetical protein [Sphingomonas aerophila]
MLMLFAAAAAVPACTGRDLSLSTDARNGDFNGMSHCGTYLVLRNRSRRACQLPGLPTVTLRDAAGRVLPLSRRAPAGMHPGPVTRPVVVPVGGQVATGLRWVSGPVYDHSRKLNVRTAKIAIAGRTLTTQLRATIYAQAGQPASFDQPPLETFR